MANATLVDVPRFVSRERQELQAARRRDGSSRSGGKSRGGRDVLGVAGARCNSAQLASSAFALPAIQASGRTLEFHEENIDKEVTIGTARLTGRETVEELGCSWVRRDNDQHTRKFSRTE